QDLGHLSRTFHEIRTPPFAPRPSTRIRRLSSRGQKWRRPAIAKTAGPSLFGPRAESLCGLIAGATRCSSHGFGRRVAERQLTAVREADFRRRGAGVPVTSAERVHDNLGARGQRVPVPATTQQGARRTAFNAPALHATVDVRVDVNPRVRVDPLELHDLAFKTDRLVAIELGGEGVVSDGSTGSPHCKDGANRGGGPLLHLHGT